MSLTATNVQYPAHGDSSQGGTSTISVDQNDRLKKRHWAMTHIDFIVNEMLYYRAHLEEWGLTPVVLMDLTDNDIQEGVVEL